MRPPRGTLPAHAWPAGLVVMWWPGGLTRFRWLGPRFASEPHSLQVARLASLAGSPTLALSMHGVPWPTGAADALEHWTWTRGRR